MRHRALALVLVLSFLPLVLVGCREDSRAGEGSPAPVQPFDYLGADLSAYPPIPQEVYTDMTLVLSRKSLWLYDGEEPENTGAGGDETQDAADEYDAKILRFALEDAVLLLLTEAYGDGEVPAEDYAYNLAALENYFESMRVYENTLLDLYGTPEDQSPDLASYVAKTFSLVSAAAGETYLRENARAIARANLAVALVFHSAPLSLDPAVLRETAAALNEETAADFFTPTDVPLTTSETLTETHPYVRNQALYDAVMDYLLRDGNYTIQWVD